MATEKLLNKYLCVIQYGNSFCFVWCARHVVHISVFQLISLKSIEFLPWNVYWLNSHCWISCVWSSFNSSGFYFISFRKLIEDRQILATFYKITIFKFFIEVIKGYRTNHTLRVLLWTLNSKNWEFRYINYKVLM